MIQCVAVVKPRSLLTCRCSDRRVIAVLRLTRLMMTE